MDLERMSLIGYPVGKDATFLHITVFTFFFITATQSQCFSVFHFLIFMNGEVMKLT